MLHETARSKSDPHAALRSLTVLGATGTIGRNTLDLVERNKDHYEIFALSAHRDVAGLAELAIKFSPTIAHIGDPACYDALKQALNGSNIQCAAGEDALVDICKEPVDWLMAAIVGAAGLRPTYEAICRGGVIALANKECLVSAGALFTSRAAQTGATILPVDSEHSAAFQSLDQSSPENIERIVLTASGGPFRTWNAAQIENAQKSDALCHPNWTMGQKITIDSATMMNKGLELIEALHLFPVEPRQLGVVVHPQSIIHCLVEYRDGSVLAQLSEPDMRTPIAYSLSWPERMETPTKRLNLAEIGQLTFEEPDPVRFPSLRLAHDVLHHNIELGAVLNAANEIAVEAFLAEKITFGAIPALVEDALNWAESSNITRNLASLDDILACDQRARDVTTAKLAHYQA